MKLEFIGADHEVTGSCHYLQVGDKNLLVDYGMEQGHDTFVNVPLPVKAEKIDAVLVTHAHIDHTGMLPKLYADGFRGRIICTKATKDLSDIMLRDSAHIQQQEADYRNKKAGRRGSKEVVEPVYTMEDTMNVLRLFEAYPYDQKFELFEGVTFRFTDVGHLLGSASIELWLTEEGQTKKIVFSGDIGNKNQPLLRDPQPTKKADYVVMESTYGDRLHEESGTAITLRSQPGTATTLRSQSGTGTTISGKSGTETILQNRSGAYNSAQSGSGAGSRQSEPAAQSNHVRQLAQALRETLSRGGNLVIPAFAVGRTQVMLYFIKQIKEQNLVPECPDFPVYVDSPMAVEATGVFEDNEIECFDEEARAMLDKGINPLSFPNLHLSITTEESIAINDDRTPKVIISASGMCDAGRIKHHIKHNIGNPLSTILFVGYQAEGTLGRRLLDGAEKVKIFGDEYEVRAQITRIDGLSGHADKDGLLEWIGNFTPKPQQVFVVHGDDAVAAAFADTLSEEYGYQAMAPYSGTEYDLLAGQFIRIAQPVPIKEKHGTGAAGAGGNGGTGSVRAGSSSFTKLKIAARRLDSVVEASSGLPNKELDRFTKELNDLCRKYKIPEMKA